jgi:outer membrane protein OmpA-like peptidoglycan-associated protein
MNSRTVIAALFLVIGLTGLAFGQQAGGDTRRKTIAVTYPEKGRIRLVMAGTTAGPKFNAGAEVRRLRGVTQVEIELDDMVPAYMLGADYTTYVLWAITPDGQLDNLGEFRLTGSRSKLRATTRFQTIALLVTAEPHFAVQKPSRKVVLENVPPKGPGVSVETADVYFTGDSGRYYSNQSLPEVTGKEWAKQPIELIGARRAVEIAVLAQAEQFARRDLDAARDSLQQADQAYAVADRENAALFGRRAILQAERARELAEDRAEAKRKRDEDIERNNRIRDAETRTQDLQDKIDDLTSELRVTDAARVRAEEEAERAHEEVATLRVQNRSLQGQVDQLSEQLRDLQEHTTQLEQSRQAEQLAAQRDRAYTAINEMLRPLATVVPDSRGFKVILPDTMFEPSKSTLKPTASAKLNPIAAVLLAHPSVEFLVEGYTDDRGAADVNMQLSEERGRAVGDFLTSAGVAAERFKVTGYGPANPVASNKTLKGRAANRRVEIIILKP